MPELQWKLKEGAATEKIISGNLRHSITLKMEALHQENPFGTVTNKF